MVFAVTVPWVPAPATVSVMLPGVMATPGLVQSAPVIEPEPAKVQMLQPYLKRLGDLGIPHFLFINKIDKAGANPAMVRARYDPQRASIPGA